VLTLVLLFFLRGRTRSDELSIEISDLLDEMTRHSRRTRTYQLTMNE